MSPPESSSANQFEAVREQLSKPRRPNATSENSWPPLDLGVINDGRQAAPEPPLYLFGSEWEREIRSIAAAKGAPPDYVLAAVVSACASLVGNARRFEAWPGWTEPCSIWFALVGGPSAGKSPAAEPVQRLLAEIEAAKVGNYNKARREYEAQVETARIITDEWRDSVKKAHDAKAPIPPKPEEADVSDPPVRPRNIVMDITTEELAMILKSNPKGCLQFRDEMSGFLASHGRYGNDADRPFYLEAYGGRPFTVDRRKNDQPIVIPYLTLSILGGIQPDKLDTLLLKGDDDGLSARFLFVWPEPIRLVRPQNDFDLAIVSRAFSRLESLEMQDVNGALAPVILKLACADPIEKWAQDVQEEADRLGGVYGSFLGKARGVAVRLAGLIELMIWAIGTDEKSPTVVSAQSLESAITLINTYIIFMAKRVFNDAAIPEEERHAGLVARHIISAKVRHFNARKARQEWGLPNMREARTFDRALAYLEEAGWVKKVETRQGETKGRTAKNFEVNPAVFKT